MNVSKNQPDALNYQVTIEISAADYSEPLRKRLNEYRRQEAFVRYDIDEYDEIFLRHLALGYTKDMIANLRSMPFGTKSLEKRQVELINRLFPNGESERINVPRLVTRAFELRILDVDNLEPDEE